MDVTQRESERKGLVPPATAILARVLASLDHSPGVLVRLAQLGSCIAGRRWPIVGRGGDCEHQERELDAGWRSKETQRLTDHFVQVFKAW